MKTVTFTQGGYGASTIVLSGVQFEAHVPKEVSDEVALAVLRRPYFRDDTPEKVEVVKEPEAQAVPKKRGRRKRVQ